MVLLLLATPVLAQVDAGPTPQRQQKLVRMVRQDCGSCHGLLLTGGLGPPLTPSALREWPVESLVATILNGRPGTPMPPWGRFVTEDEATWIARNLRDGFPQEMEQRK
jgi:cytochrome c55X